MAVGAHYPVGEYIAELYQAAPQGLVLPYAVQAGIALQNVQMGVHRLGIVAVLLRKAHIRYGLPIAGAGLQISALYRIEAVVLDAAPQADGKFQGLLFAGGAEELRTAVHCEGYGIELFFSIEGTAVGGEAPVDAAVLGVGETVPNLGECVAGGLQIFRAAQQPVGRREGPQYAGIQYGPLGRGVVQPASAVDPGVESAGRKLHFFEPEGKDVVFEFGEDLGPQDIGFSCHNAKIGLIFI